MCSQILRDESPLKPPATQQQHDWRLAAGRLAHIVSDLCSAHKEFSRAPRGMVDWRMVAIDSKQAAANKKLDCAHALLRLNPKKVYTAKSTAWVYLAAPACFFTQPEAGTGSLAACRKRCALQSANFTVPKPEIRVPPSTGPT